MLNLVLVPNQFPPASLAIGRAYTYRFWHPAAADEWIDIGIAILIWPIGIVFCALWFTRQNGPIVASRFGRSVARQFADQLRLAVTSGLLPAWYYIFELYRPGGMRRARSYMTRGQTKYGAYRLLATIRRSSSPLSDKEQFAHFCAERQIDALPVLFAIHDGELRGEVTSAAQLPATDLFVKPVQGRGGKGAERWDFDQRGVYRDRYGEQLCPAQFVERLREMSRRQPYLVQERAHNHPAMRDLSNGALNTIRMITCLDENEQPEIVAAVLRMAVGDNVTVDNVHAGGLAAAIDLTDGRLRQATDMGLDSRLGWIDRHPDTGGHIAGRTLPLWADVRELVQRAHLAFRDWAVVGWDIAIMADRPRLVEGNSGPDVDLVQRPLRTSFGDARFGYLLAFHLKQSESAWRVPRQGAHCLPRTAFASPASPGRG